ncbi:MAG: cytochrome P450 [Deltaproteobacteria bacterium]|nr:cytochrome P450 [Deltaproteobacteria bacterium]
MSDLLSTKLHELAANLGEDAKLIPKELESLISKELLEEAEKIGLKVFDINLADLAKNLATWAVDHIDLIFKILRTVRPVVLFAGFGLITRYEDVVDTLAQDDVFATTNLEQLRQVSGNDFILGMANTPDYTRDHTNLRAAIRRSDIPTRVSDFALQDATKRVDAAQGSLDIVTGLTRAVNAAWAGDYFGTPGPSPTTLVDWCVTIFNFLTIPPGTDPAGEKAGLEAGKAFQAYVAQLIEQRHSTPGVTDDVLGRLLTLQPTGMPGLSDDLIKSNLVGMISGAIPPTATMAAIAMDELLGRPAALAGAQAAARAGDATLVGRYVDEAMRFHPIGPGVLRITTEDFLVGRDRWYARTVPKGTTVMIATRSAMFDEALFANPTSFEIDRNEYNFLLYGSGIHTCFGKYIASAMIPRILMPLLARQNLRRAQGQAGTLQMEGVQAKSLTLEWLA